MQLDFSLSEDSLEQKTRRSIQSGESGDTSVYGIYKFETANDGEVELVYCIGLEKRPTDFSVVPGSGRQLIRLRKLRDDSQWAKLTMNRRLISKNVDFDLGKSEEQEDAKNRFGSQHLSAFSITAQSSLLLRPHGIRVPGK